MHRVAVFVATSLVALCASAGPSAKGSSAVGDTRAASAPSEGLLASLYGECGARSLALDAVASELLARRVRKEAAPSSERIAELTEAEGVAQPWPRAWSLASRSPSALAGRFDAWLARGSSTTGAPANLRRCGLAHQIDASGETTLAAVTVDALAELAPLPRTTRVYGWVSFDARLLVDASDAKVVLLDPSGEPKRVLTSLTGKRVRSRFNLDRAGVWTVQLLATLDSGPIPVLEARLTAGAEPVTEAPATEAVPEKDAVTEKGAVTERDAVRALAELVSATRKKAGVRGLARDVALDRVAAAHARAMRDSRKVAHDLGDGSPRARVRDAGVVAKQVGENVSHAACAEAAHRALFASPSHRENLIFPGFRRIGIGTARDADGSLWVTELFAD